MWKARSLELKTCACMSACLPACLPACLSACMCVCMYICNVVHTHASEILRPIFAGISTHPFEGALRLTILKTRVLHPCLLSSQTNVILPAAVTMTLAMKGKTLFPSFFLSYTLFVPILSQMPNDGKGRSSNGRRVQTSPPHLTFSKLESSACGGLSSCAQ